MKTHAVDGQLFAFACTHCGRCCTWKGDVHVAGSDIDRLAAFLGLEKNSFIARYTRLAYHRRGLSLQDGPDHACVFLEGQRCSVYEARPDQCRRFPFPYTTPDDCPGLSLIEEPSGTG